MEYIVIVGEWLGIDAAAGFAMQAVEAVLHASGPVTWILGAAGLVVLGLVLARLLGGGDRW